MTNAKHMPWLVLIAALLFAAGPFLVPFDGFEANDFPIPQDDPLVQPPGWAFSIWGLIYPWLILCAVVGATLRRETPEWSAHRPWLMGALLIGAVWLPVSVASPLWATVLIWIMLLTAIAALARTPKSDRWLLRVPIALFAGWLTAASAISIGIIGAGFDVAFSARTWAFIAVGIASFVAAVVLLSLGRLPEYSAPLFWGLAALAVGVSGKDTHLFVAVIAALVFLGAMTIFAARLSDGIKVDHESDHF